jgi:polyhydroxyalkanoate synthesis regulator phasin
MTKRICSGKIEALVDLLVEKGIITKDEVMVQFKRLDREMKERGGRVNISWVNIT